MDDAKKELILKEAAHVFGQYGYRKASIEEIAEGARVAKGTVYLACKSKEDLFFQVLEREVRLWVDATRERINPSVPADELLLQVSAFAMEYVESRPLVRELMFANLSDTLPTWEDRLDELRAASTQILVELLELGILQGVFDARIDVSTVAELVQDLLLATFLFHNRGADRQDRIQKRALSAFDMVLHGICREKSLPK